MNRAPLQKFRAMSFGQFLRAARKKKGYTLESISHAIGCSDWRYMGMVERDQRTLPLKYIRLISKKYDLTDFEIRWMLVREKVFKLQIKYGLFPDYKAAELVMKNAIRKPKKKVG